MANCDFMVTFEDDYHKEMNDPLFYESNLHRISDFMETRDIKNGVDTLLTKDNHLAFRAFGGGIETLTALGQLVGIWVGGGTIVPWAVIPVAAICGIDPFELTKKNFKPVVIGIVLTTLVAIFII